MSDDRLSRDGGRTRSVRSDCNVERVRDVEYGVVHGDPAEALYKRRPSAERADVSPLPNDAEVLMVEKETTGRRMVAQRDEIIATLLRKAEESSELFANLEGRLVEAEREIDDLRAQNEHLRREAARGLPEMEQVVERERHIDALEAEMREKERTNQLMNEMLGESNAKIDLLKQHHDEALAEKAKELEERAREIDHLADAEQQLRLDVCAIFGIAPQDTTAGMLDSVEAIKQYIDRRDTDIAALEDEMNKVSDERDDACGRLAALEDEHVKYVKANDLNGRDANERVQTLTQALDEAERKEQRLRTESARALQDEAAALSQAQAELAAALDRLREAEDDLAALRAADRDAQDTGASSLTRAAQAAQRLRGVLEEHGVVVAQRGGGSGDAAAQQIDAICEVIVVVLNENRALRQSRNRSRRQKEEVNGVVLDDPDLQEMQWGSDEEDSLDDDDLSDHPSGNARWAETRVRVRTLVERLVRRERDAAKYRQKYSDLKAAMKDGQGYAKAPPPPGPATPSRASAASTTHTTGPYLGLITETIRAVDDVGPGVRLLEVRRGSAADSAGLVCGDRVVEFNGEPVACAYDLEQVLRGVRPGDTLAVAFLRGDLLCDTHIVVDVERERRRRRRRKMDRSEIQARVASSSRGSPGARRRNHG